MEPTKRPWDTGPERGGNSGIWEAGKDEPIAFFSYEEYEGETVYLDNYEANAPYIVKCVNAHDGLVAALKEVTKGEGAFSRDNLEHADNCIESMKAIAKAALAEVEPQHDKG